jgi:hypothetical protein
MSNHFRSSPAARCPRLRFGAPHGAKHLFFLLPVLHASLLVSSRSTHVFIRVADEFLTYPQTEPSTHLAGGSSFFRHRKEQSVRTTLFDRGIFLPGIDDAGVQLTATRRRHRPSDTRLRNHVAAFLPASCPAPPVSTQTASRLPCRDSEGFRPLYLQHSYQREVFEPLMGLHEHRLTRAATSRLTRLVTIAESTSHVGTCPQRGRPCAYALPFPAGQSLHPKGRDDFSLRN